MHTQDRDQIDFKQIFQVQDVRAIMYKLQQIDSFSVPHAHLVHQSLGEAHLASCSNDLFWVRNGRRQGCSRKRSAGYRTPAQAQATACACLHMTPYSNIIDLRDRAQVCASAVRSSPSQSSSRQLEEQANRDSRNVAQIGGHSAVQCVASSLHLLVLTWRSQGQL